MILATSRAIFMYTQESGFEIWVVIKIIFAFGVLSIILPSVGGGRDS